MLLPTVDMDTYIVCPGRSGMVPILVQDAVGFSMPTVILAQTMCPTLYQLLEPGIV